MAFDEGPCRVGLVGIVGKAHVVQDAVETALVLGVDESILAVLGFGDDAEGEGVADDGILPGDSLASGIGSAITGVDDVPAVVVGEHLAAAGIDDEAEPLRVSLSAEHNVGIGQCRPFSICGIEGVEYVDVCRRGDCGDRCHRVCAGQIAVKSGLQGGTQSLQSCHVEVRQLGVINLHVGVELEDFLACGVDDMDGDGPNLVGGDVDL